MNHANQITLDLPATTLGKLTATAKAAHMTLAEYAAHLLDLAAKAAQMNH